MHATRLVPSLVAASLLAACAETSPLAPSPEASDNASMSNGGIWVPPPQLPEWPPPRELPPPEQPPHEVEGGR
jgi:hypothetical protein